MSTHATDYILSELYLYLTDHCNLCCTHCWITPKFSSNQQITIPLDALKHTILEAKSLGLQRVKLTGGEPLLYPELIPLIEFLADENISPYIETNGILLDEKFIESFRSGKISHISVSLDAASEGIHDTIRGVRGSFRQAKKGLRLLSNSGLRFQIIMTLQRKNKYEIQKLMDLAQDLGAASLKINPLHPCGRGVNAFNQGQNLNLDELIALYKTAGENRQNSKNINILFDLPTAFLSMNDIRQTAANRCHILNILGILSSGAFSICGIGEAFEELRMGTIQTASISDVWRNNTLLNELRQSLPGSLKGICGKCIFRFQCLGACRANAYAIEKDIYAPYFLCNELYESGRFPKSRYIET